MIQEEINRIIESSHFPSVFSESSVVNLLELAQQLDVVPGQARRIQEERPFTGRDDDEWGGGLGLEPERGRSWLTGPRRRA